MITSVDGVTVTVGRGDESEVVDGHTRHGIQLLDTRIDTLEVGSGICHGLIHILLVGKFVLRRSGSGEQTIDSLEYVIERAGNDGILRILRRLLIKRQGILLVGQCLIDTTTLNGVRAIECRLGVEVKNILLGTYQLHQCLIGREVYQLLNQQSCDA